MPKDRLAEFFTSAADLVDIESGKLVAYPPAAPGRFEIRIKPRKVFHGDATVVCESLVKRHAGCSFAFAATPPAPVRRETRKSKPKT